MVLGSTQSLTEMSTRNLPGGKGRPARKADNLSPSTSRLSRENMGASTSLNPMVLHSLLQVHSFTFFSICLSVILHTCGTYMIFLVREDVHILFEILDAMVTFSRAYELRHGIYNFYT
jgi:hypothetical protein